MIVILAVYLRFLIHLIYWHRLIKIIMIIYNSINPYQNDGIHWYVDVE